MHEILKKWEHLLKTKIELGIISNAQADILYWLVEASLLKVVDAGDKLENNLRYLNNLIQEAVRTSNVSLEDTALQELVDLLLKHDVLEPRFSAPKEFNLRSVGGFVEELRLDGSFISLRDPIDVSILKLGAKHPIVGEEGNKDHFQNERDLLRENSESIFDKLLSFMKIAILKSFYDKESVYEDAGRIYRQTSSSVLHFARTPGILNPDDYKDAYRKRLFRSITRSPAPVVYYVCNYSTTIDDLKKRIEDNENDQVLRETARHLIPFVATQGLEIVLADIPSFLFNDEGNVSIVTDSYILKSIRSKTRIVKAHRFTRHAMKKVTSKIPVVNFLNMPVEHYFKYIQEWPMFLSLNEVSSHDEPEMRAKEIAEHLIRLAS